MARYLLALIGIGIGGFELYQGWKGWKLYKSGKMASKNTWMPYAFGYSFFIAIVLLLMGIAALFGAFEN